MSGRPSGEGRGGGQEERSPAAEGLHSDRVCQTRSSPETARPDRTPTWSGDDVATGALGLQTNYSSSWNRGNSDYVFLRATFGIFQSTLTRSNFLPLRCCCNLCPESHESPPSLLLYRHHRDATAASGLVLPDAQNLDVPIPLCSPPSLILGASEAALLEPISPFSAIPPHQPDSR